MGESLTDPVALGIVVGLVVGKTIGIFGSTYLVARFTRARLDDDLRWIDVVGLSVLAGIGFTVSLLIGDLAFGADGTRDEHVKLGVLCGSLLAARARGGALACPQPGLSTAVRGRGAGQRSRRHPRRLREWTRDRSATAGRCPGKALAPRRWRAM